MEQVVRLAKDVVLRQGYHVPQLVLCGTKGNAAVVLPDFPNEHEEKVTYMMLTGKYLSKNHSLGKLRKVFLVLEAWMGKNVAIRPSQDPQRVEVLVVSSLDVLTEEQTVISLEYIRDADGILREIKEMVLSDGERAASVESPLLPALVAGYNHRS